MPGTTRDLVTERIALGGIPLELVDTAGLREGVDEAERLGIARSHEALADAAIVLIVIDASAAATMGLSDEDRRLIAAVEGRPALVALNKSDLLGADSLSMGAIAGSLPVLPTSAVTGAGMMELREAILRLATGGAAAEPGMLTSVRHQRAIDEALAGLRDAESAMGQAIPHEMVLLDLYRALAALDSLTGQTTPDDVLNLIFSTFCIGK